MSVTVTVLSPRFRRLQRRAERTARAILRSVRVPGATCDVYLASGAVMRRLGARITNHRGPWNVLAFRAPEGAPQPDRRVRSLGEVYVDPSVAVREARQGALPAHAVRAAEQLGTSGAACAYYLVHGILHLLGYDHVRRRDRMAMERKERQVLQSVADTW